MVNSGIAHGIIPVMFAVAFRVISALLDFMSTREREIVQMARRITANSAAQAEGIMAIFCALQDSDAGSNIISESNQ